MTPRRSFALTLAVLAPALPLLGCLLLGGDRPAAAAKRLPAAAPAPRAPLASRPLELATRPATTPSAPVPALPSPSAAVAPAPAPPPAPTAVAESAPPALSATPALTAQERTERQLSHLLRREDRARRLTQGRRALGLAEDDPAARGLEDLLGGGPELLPDGIAPR